MNQAMYRRRHEEKKRAQGYVRGPRITGEAAERLRTLAFIHGITPSEVVSRLLIGAPMTGVVAVVQNPHGFSEQEARDFNRMQEGWVA